LSGHGRFDRKYSDYKLKRAQRVLDEYKWRERPFFEHHIDPLQLEYSIRAIATLLGSSTNYPIHGVTAALHESHRLLLYEMIINMIESRSNKSPLFIRPI
jgi:hypothetical protein